MESAGYWRHRRRREIRFKKAGWAPTYLPHFNQRCFLAIILLLAIIRLEFTWLFADENIPVLSNRSLLAQQASRMRTDQTGLNRCGEAVSFALKQFSRAGLGHAEKCLIVYHVGFLGKSDSFQMNADNIRIFLSSFKANSRRNATFLVVNVSGGAYNPLLRVVEDYILSCELFCTLLWSANDSDMMTHALTLGRSELRAAEFGAIFALNNGVRGPLVRRNTWISDFTSLFSKDIALVGPVISCEKRPHVQTHMFGISSTILDLFLANELLSSSGESWSKVIERCEIGLSQSVIKADFRMASMLHKRRWGEDYFKGECREELGQRNPTGWCEPYFRDSLFVKWGGEFYRQRLYCERVIRIIEHESKNILNSMKF